MRIATYNLNNLFERAKVFELEGMSAEARKIISAYNTLVELLEKPSYSQADKARIAAIIEQYVESGKAKSFILINEVRGKLYSFNSSTKKATITANGRAEWLGWAELIKAPVNDAATANTARVVKTVDADILCAVEVEGRIALKNFNNHLLNNQYSAIMVIDGNDERGIDVGLLSKSSIRSIESHVDDRFKGLDGKFYPIFSRDCAVYEVKYKSHTIHLLCNHFKSKGYGSQVSNDAKRKKQAQRVKEILSAYNLKTEFVVVAGDLNDVPGSDPLSPLLNMQRLVNVVNKKLPEGSRGTYLNKKDEQIDYLLVSEGLMAFYKEAGIERRGIFKNNSTDMFDTVTSTRNQASDHAAVWAEFDL